jgi:hypothetical protein
VRWAPLAVGLVFLGAALVWLGNDVYATEERFPPGSSLSRAPEGLGLARAYLAREGTDVRTLAWDISSHETPPDAVVFRVTPHAGLMKLILVGADGGHGGGAGDGGPQASFWPDDDEDEEDSDAGVVFGTVDGGVESEGKRTDFESKRLLLRPEDARFVAAGGRLVLAIDQSHGALKVEPAEAPLERVLPLLPGVRRLDTNASLGLVGPGLVDAVTLFERGAFPVLTRTALGKGDVFLLSSPDVLTNERLSRGDNLALLAALAGKGRPVLFDESVHGLWDRPGIVDLLRRWGFGPALLLLALLAGVAFWRRAVTLGRPSDWRDVRTESVDLVQALAQLYQRALRPADALALHHARLVHDIQLRLGLSPKAAAEKARELTSGWEPSATRLGQGEFQRQLDVLNEAMRRLRDDSAHRA